jgi:hypothetical protein
MGVVLPLAVASPGAAPSAWARHGGGASLTIHNALCPSGYGGEDFFNDCHDTPNDGSVFALDGPRGRLLKATTEAVADPGPSVAVFTGIRKPGIYTLTRISSPTAVADFRVFCFRGEGAEELIPVTPVDGGVRFELVQHDVLLCDWYDIAAGGEGDGPPTRKAQCKRGGWRDFEIPRRFESKRDCVRFVRTGT